MNVEWDEDKEQRNITKHGISFVMASKIFLVKRFEVPSPKNNEERYVAIAEVGENVTTVVYTMRGSNYRIISARKASKQERRKYEQNYQTSIG